MESSEWLQLTRARPELALWSFGCWSFHFWCHTSPWSAAVHTKIPYRKWLFGKMPQGLHYQPLTVMFPELILTSERSPCSLHLPASQRQHCISHERWTSQVSHATYSWQYSQPSSRDTSQGKRVQVSYKSWEWNSTFKSALLLCIPLKKCVWGFSPIRWRSLLVQNRLRRSPGGQIPLLYLCCTLPCRWLFSDRCLECPLSNISYSGMDKCLGFWVQCVWKINRRH